MSSLYAFQRGCHMEKDTKKQDTSKDSMQRFSFNCLLPFCWKRLQEISKSCSKNHILNYFNDSESSESPSLDLVTVLFNVHRTIFVN